MSWGETGSSDSASARNDPIIVLIRYIGSLPTQELLDIPTRKCNDIVTDHTGNDPPVGVTSTSHDVGTYLVGNEEPISARRLGPRMRSARGGVLI